MILILILENKIIYYNNEILVGSQLDNCDNSEPRVVRKGLFQQRICSMFTGILKASLKWYLMGWALMQSCTMNNLNGLH